jgi:hypothetical protein
MGLGVGRKYSFKSGLNMDSSGVNLKGGSSFQSLGSAKKL